MILNSIELLTENHVTLIMWGSDDRVCQMRINKAMPKVIFNEVEDMESEDRGGFGTTGTK